MVDLREAFHYVNMRRKLYFDQFIDEVELNLMEIEILVFLNQYPENNTFTEIMRSKGYAKSYVSKAISNLVELEYIRKQGIENNKKVYRLFLLDKSQSVIEAYDACVKKFRNDAFAGIDNEDLEIFDNVINKIANNLTED